MLLYLIWTFLVGSIALMIGVMIYNEWFAPQTPDGGAGEATLSPIVTAGSESAASIAPPLESPAPSAPRSRGGSRKKAPARKTKPTARKGRR